MSPAGSQIDGQRVAAGFAAVFFAVPLKVLQCSDVRIGEIVDMDVVANAGAIGGGIVGAVNLQLSSVLGGGRNRQWNQVSLRIVELARLATFIGSRGVEVAQSHRAQSVRAVVSLERIFETKL